MQLQDSHTRPLPEETACAEDVERALERLYAALESLAHELAAGTEPVVVDYEVQDVGTLRRLEQREYAVTTEDVDPPRFSLSFCCMGRHALTHQAASIDEKQRIREQIESVGLQFGINDLATWRYVLAIQPVVPVRLVFEPAPDRAAIRVTIHNLRRLGVERYSIDPDAVGSDLITELRKLVLREDNRFAEFTGTQVPLAVRERLQERLRKRALSREKEAEGDSRDDVAHKLKRLLPGQGRRPATPAPVSVPRPHHAPCLQDADALAAFEWEPPGAKDSAPPTDAATAGTDTTPVACADSGAAPGSPPAQPRDEEQRPAYAWLITHGVAVESTATSLGRLGPPGTARGFSVSKVLRTGAEFRLLDRAGQVRYSGRIAGNYQGMEPVVDFGMDHDCFMVEYNRDGQWVRARTATR